MKSFKDIIQEQEEFKKPAVIAFGRMNPPTTGHLKMIDKVRETAARLNAHHEVIASHSQDNKKNPLTAEQKIKHLQKYSPGTNFVAASKEQPSIFHHAEKLSKAGHDHLVVVAGSDRVKEFHDSLNKYNGKPNKEGHVPYNFKKITVISAGHRDPDSEGAEGMSGTKMREHAKNRDFASFRQGVPAHVDDKNAKELMHDTRKGMGLNEDNSRGQFRAIFVTGGPGSGKDVVIREAIAESKIVELNLVQAQEYLGDKQKLSEQTRDYRREAIRNRGPLIINGPADDRDRIMQIKEELEDLGYGTMMVFVNTTNETSRERNSLLSRMMVESMRHDKWLRSQENTKYFNEVFSKFVVFDNTGEIKEEDVHEVYESTSKFLDSKIVGETAQEWLERRKSLNINTLFKEYRNVKKDYRLSEDKTSRVNELFPGIQLQRKLNKKDDVRDGDIKATGGYTFKTYHEASQPTVEVQPEPKETNFRRDKEKEKLKRLVRNPSGAIRTGGVGPEYDTRQQGTVYPMSGMGDVTYREQKEFKDFRKHRNPVAHASQKVGPGSGKHKQKSKDAVRGEKHKKKQYHEAIDDPGANDMGVAGVLGGSSNKEPMQKISDTYGKIKLLRKKNVKV